MTNTTFDTPDGVLPSAFGSASDQIRACWELGYHDGLKGIIASVGRAALNAFIVSDFNRRFEEAEDGLAKKRAQQSAARLRKEQSDAQLGQAEEQLMPAFARHTIGVLPRVVAYAYLVLGALAVLAELPLSGLTVGESLGISIDAAQMQALQRDSIVALTVMLCLLGFSLKLLADVIDRGRRHHLWETVLVAGTVALSTMSIYEVAQLRGAISKATIADKQASLASQLPNVNDERVQRAVDAAQEAMADRTAQTFTWVTLALPCFAAVAFIVGLHQLRNYRGHNLSLQALAEASTVAPIVVEELARLDIEIEEQEKRLKKMLEGDPEAGSLRERAAAAYEHGAAVGTAERDERVAQLGVFDRLDTAFRRSLPIRGALA